MTTTNFRHVSVLALGVLCACQLPPDLLEAGNADDGDTAGDGDTSGDAGDTGELDPDEHECVLQGTNLVGDSEPEDDFSLPLDCEIVCNQGWGHGVPLLESDWTAPPRTNPFYETPTHGALAIAPDQRPVMLLDAPDVFHLLQWVTPEGEYEEARGSQPSDEVLDFGIDADQAMYYFLRTDGMTQRLVATDGTPAEFFSVELGPHHESNNSTFAVIDDGVIVAVAGDVSQLMRIDQAGEILFEQPIPTTSRIDVSPSGDVIALANTSTLGWADAQGNFLGDQAIDEVSSVLGLVAVDDTHVVFAGGEPAPGGGSQAFLRELGAMGPGWSHSYDRADTWCMDATEELFTGIAQLGDGTLVVTGIESLGYPYGNDIDHASQPWVAHVSAAGEVLEVDRGLWQGRTVDVVTRENVAYVLLTKDSSVDVFGLPYLRKYSF